MRNILVIDDDTQIRSMLRRVLEREGYVVEEACDGLEGLRIYRENPADLVITDIIMPNKEGIELIKDLLHEFPDIKIIATSGGGNMPPQLYLGLAEGLGVDQVFAKPFDIKELLAAVKALLE